MSNGEEDWRPQEIPALIIGRIARLLARRDDERLREVGLSTAQLPVLVALKNGETLTQKELANFAGVEQPSMAQLLARMERDGLIQRHSDPEDRRSSLISLTADALDLLGPGRSVLRDGNAEALEGFSADEVQILTEMLQRIHANVAND